MLVANKPRTLKPFVRRISAAIVPCCMMLAGCATPDRFVTNEHYLGNVESGQTGYFAEYAASQKTQDSSILASKYLQAGMKLTEVACSDYLEELAKNTTNVGYAKSQLGITVVLATGVLGIAGAAQEVYTGLALGNAYANASSDLYRDTYLLGQYPAEVRGLAENAMTAVRDTIKESPPPATFTDAFHYLNSYAKACSVETIRELVRQSIVKAKPAATANGGAENRDRQHTDELSKLLNVPSLSPQQMAALYWLTALGTNTDDEIRLIQVGLGNLKEKIYPNGKVDLALTRNVGDIMHNLSNAYGTLVRDKVRRYQDEIRNLDAKRLPESDRANQLPSFIWPDSIPLGASSPGKITVSVQ